MHSLMLPYYKALATAREVLADNLTYRPDRDIDLTLALRDLLEALDMLPDGLSNAITESNAFYALNIEDCIKIIREQLTVEYNGECSYAGALDTLNFYRKRCELLQQVQARMRDPERTLVCDILANGQLLGSVDGPRYSPPTEVHARDESPVYVCEGLTVPVWAVHYANELGAYFKAQNTGFWAIGPIQSRYGEVQQPAAAVPVVLTDAERKALEGAMANAEHDAGDVEDACPSIKRDEDAYWAWHKYHGLRKLLQAPPAAVPADFAEWLAREMPAGTVIGDPHWWANLIARRYAQFAAKENANG